MTAGTPGRRKRTAREAAALLGVSERTIRNIVAEPRDDYEARARERRNPAPLSCVNGGFCTGR